MALDPTMGGTLKFASVTPIWSVRVPEGVSLGFHSFGVIHNGSREGRMCRNEAFTCLFHLRGRCFLPQMLLGSLTSVASASTPWQMRTAAI
jgi:hypothetical protein